MRGQENHRAELNSSIPLQAHTRDSPKGYLPPLKSSADKRRALMYGQELVDSSLIVRGDVKDMSREVIEHIPCLIP